LLRNLVYVFGQSGLCSLGNNLVSVDNMDLNESVNGAAYKRVSLLQMSSDGTETLFKSVAGAATDAPSSW